MNKRERLCKICKGTHSHLYASGSQWVHAECLPPEPHWFNPWEDVVYVPIEELVDCAYGLGKAWTDVDGSSFLMTRERMLAHWKQAGDKLDAYILPCGSGHHSIGVRYGEDGPNYLSPHGDTCKVAALLHKYKPSE